MNLHANAALSWMGRRRLCELVVDQGWTVTAAAASAGVSVRCARKWIARYRSTGRPSCSTARRRRGVSRIEPLDPDVSAARGGATPSWTATVARRCGTDRSCRRPQLLRRGRLE